ncbi:glycosyltransferase [Acidilobus sp. 7A]|uniref:glycosyltransferase n=1 Tax=Acidilobus sp. 7A TaxID=1577685 RepID=UPI001314E4B7|nr:glycosyltransferase [Acidilobus sp. 7A]
MSKLCLYGTVLNSVDIVERSIRSVFRPDADIVITDGGSRDGTYEKLLEISKDYNLRVYRAPGSSRGLGRQLALVRCPENSYTAYFDLDDEYNVYFHKSIDWGMATGSPRPLLGHGLREYILSRGGWRDINYGEDYEIWARVEFDNSLPLVTAVRIRKMEFRSFAEYELRRYARGLWSSLRRTLRHEVDIIRGYGYTLSEYLQEPAFKRRPYLKPAALLVYGIARLKGVYRYDRRLNNQDLVIYKKLQRIRDPVKELGADESYAAMIIPCDTALRIGLSWAAGRLRSAGLRPYLCERTRGMALVGMRSPSAIDVINESVYLKLVRCKPLEEVGEGRLGPS